MPVAVTIQVPELAGSEGEPVVSGVPPGIAISQRRKQQRPGVRTHVHTVRDQSDRPEEEAADDLGDHHQSTENNDGPSFALATLLIGGEENVAVEVEVGVGSRSAHVRHSI